MKILLIGPQGSGKSTQAGLLSEHLKIPVISTGEIFRKLSQKEAGIGGMIRRILEEGKLVGDDTTSSIVKERLQEDDCQNGFIMDGYPRNLDQLKLFDPEFDKVFYLNVPEKEVSQRLLRRGRADDTEEAVKTRLDLYYLQTQPLLDYYKNQDILAEIDARGDIQSIQDEIKKSL